MALVFDNQGQYAKALELYERALAGREKVLGVDHPLTQNTIRSLINILGVSQGFELRTR